MAWYFNKIARGKCLLIEQTYLVQKHKRKEVELS